MKTIFLVEGIITLLFGVVAILLPPMAGLAAAILLGWLLMASGAVGMAATLRTRQAPGFWWSLFSAIVTLLAGAMLFAWPLGGLISLSLALGVFLALDGVLAIGLALEHRRQMTLRWLWLLANGVSDLAFAAVILLWLPSTALWALGFFIGADMLISGSTLIALAVDMENQDGGEGLVSKSV